MMTQPSTCAQCGSSLPDDASEDLCPKCQIEAGLMSEVGEEAAITADFSPSEVIREAQAPAPVPAKPLPRLFGGYRIVRPLGKGGMGKVYEAEEQASGRRLALKVLSHSLDSEQARTRFFREGRLAASINHPNCVYIFGTEVIDSMPVITMELAQGGTLQDLVKREGPLPISRAVDAILQIIAGLEAAAGAGILHRDVKPSNCFVDADGSVKVGDFGLSISTLAAHQSDLTDTSTMLGTPAYAAPEQLRGDEIDCRSDIYAVGVTLYYLLTAQTPFKGDNMVRLLATVLEQPAESPRKLRPQIPVELAQVVLRCLAKQPSQRFRNYGEFRLALLPFSLTELVPASRGLRFLAGIVDGLMVFALFATGAWFLLLRGFASAPGRSRAGTWGALLFSCATILIPASYMVIPEGAWGASLGKALLGLRVVGLKRRLPGLPRALLRAVIVFFTYMAGTFLGLMLVSVAMISRDATHSAAGHPLLGVLPLMTPYVFLMALFVMARRKNGLAAVQDLASGTRVVLKPAFQVRATPASTPEPAAAVESTQRIGPYHALSAMGRSGSAELLLGYDPRLFRKVWLRRLPPGTEEVPPVSRVVTRHGRLRWLGGKRSEAENWDAYEAPSGGPLVSLLQVSQPWKRVRYWLADLAVELEASLKERSLPSKLDLNQIWITDDGRAKLLDFIAPGLETSDFNEASVIAAAPPTDGDIQLFLKQAALAAVEGRIEHASAPIGEQPNIPLPLRARSFIEKIGSFPACDQLIAELRVNQASPAEISWSRRLVLLAGCIVPAVVMSILMAAMLWSAMKLAGGLAQSAVQLTELRLCVNEWDRLKQDPHNKQLGESLQTYIAVRFKNLANDPRLRDTTMLTPDQRHEAQTIIASHANATDQQFKEAAEQVKSLGISPTQKGQMGKASVPTGFQFFMIVMMGYWAFMIGLPALVAALLFRGGLLLHGLRMTIVTRGGAPARRWRVFLRGLITWMPVILAPVLLPPAPLPAGVISAIYMVIVVTYAAAALWSLRNPARGVQDWLARTYIVPR